MRDGGRNDRVDSSYQSARASVGAAPALSVSPGAGPSRPPLHRSPGLPAQPPPPSHPPLHLVAPGPETQPTLSDLAAESPHILAIKAALTAPKAAAFNNAVSLYTASIHVACAAAFLAAHAACAPGADHDQADSAAAHAADLRFQASALHAALSRLPRVRPASLANTRCARLQALILGVIGGGPARDSPLPLPETAPVTPGALVPFEHSSHMCMAALSAGWSLADALALWSPVHWGSFSASGRTFFPGPRTPQSPPETWNDAEVRSITRAPGEAPLAVYIRHGRVLAIAAGSCLRVLRGAARSPISLADLTSFIALPRDAQGRPIIPKSRVTALVEAQLAWHTELGTLDNLSSTIVRGLLVMPKIATPSQRVSLRNHPSWEGDPAAQLALGPIIAKWLAQGVLEYVQWDDRQPVLLQPCGAVPKGSAPFYRLITDARYGNTMYSDWGVSYQSAADLSAVVHHRDFTWSADLQDAYHLSVFAGCGGVLRPCRRPVLAGDGTVTWLDGWVVGCTPGSCLGGCDKDMSGLSINGHIFRFAACQFGQKTAGSPLNALVMSVARYFARLPTAVHIAAWVDDLHFSLRTPDHPPCAGHAGGCPVCTAAFHTASEMEELWKSKARALNLPLSDGKGHSTAQGGPFTGVQVDTFQGRFLMLTEKLISSRVALLAAHASTDSTPRLLARCRGKAFHYGCAIAHLSSLCPALTQAIHQAESAHDLPAPSAATEAANARFNWDQPIRVSVRTRATLSLMLRVLSQCGELGQPMWPLPPGAVFGQFCTDELHGTMGCPLVFLTSASPSGWGAAIRSSTHGQPLVVSGGWDVLRGLLDAPWMAGFTPSDSGGPESVDHQLALAILLALHASSPLVRLHDRPIIFRSASAVAISAFQRGSGDDPVLQDIVMLFTSACLDLRLSPPLFLGTLSGRTATADPDTAHTRIDSASPRLRARIRDLAHRAGLQITMDLFASRENAFCARYCSELPDPQAEARDAFTQPSWACSRCPICARLRPEFVLLYPPFNLIGQAVRRAQVDRAHGVMVVPFATTASWWQTLMHASRSRTGTFRPAFRLPCSPDWVLHQSNPPGHSIALLHFDFWSSSDPRPRPCLHGHVPRPHPTSESDQADFWHIHSRLDNISPR